MIRRRLKNPDLKFEAVYVGEKSQTAVAITYIKGIVDEKVLEDIRKKVKNLDLRFVLDSNYIECNLKKENSFFDTVGYTEKPDEVCAKILEGRVALIVDGTSFVITVPYFFIITHHFSMIPTLFIFRLAVSRAGVPLPTFVEVIIMMLAFQFIKEAGIRLPKAIGSAMSIVSALILGDAAVGAGVASRITIIVVAISTLCYFLIPKLYGAVSFWSIVLVCFAALLGLPGFLSASLIFMTQICELDSVGYPFLFPLGSLSEYRFKDILFRGSLNRISRKIIGVGCDKDGKNR